ncbi:MAG: cytochrome c oxidase assembly protein subunit 15 [Roseivirga sp.]|jgi:cytochrome c oxidase assembly protein subunit 15
MQQQAINGKFFRRLSATTVIAVYLLILVGGIVRSTGSGMGCPDWPKCFGSWIPPTEVSQLPFDYKDIYAQQRADKNVKFVSYLTAFGFEDLADQIKNDPDMLKEDDFNAVKTWTEYINRLIGAVIGLLIFGTFVMSLRYWKVNRTITVLSFLAFVLVGVQGWIGSIVVSTNLLQWMITIHMLLALVIVCLLIYVYFRAKAVTELVIPNRKRVSIFLMITIFLTLIQVVLGTQVREALDVLSDSLNRSEWIENLGIQFKIHRSFSLVLIAAHFYVIRLLYHIKTLPKSFRILLGVLIGSLGIEVASGVIMAYFGVPAAAQPVHLLLGTLIVGLQYYVLLQVGNKSLKIVSAE